MKDKVVIKSSKAGMTVIMDAKCDFSQLLEEIAKKFQENAKFWGSVQMALMLEGRELTATEEFEIVNTITENSSVEILCLIDRDTKRMEACEKALNEKLMELSSRTGQFYKGDLHRGESIESETSIVIIGDVCHGSKVVAKGNVVVLGELKGTVHAGAAGNQEAVVAAMEMQPLQIKIADFSQHYGDKNKKISKGPAIAFVENCSICTKPIKKSGFSMLNFN